MEYKTLIGGIGFRVQTDNPIETETAYIPFFTEYLPEATVTVRYINDCPHIPTTLEKKCGENLLLEYYRMQSDMICLAKGGPDGPLAMTVWNPDFSKIECHVTAEYPQTLGNLLRLIPMHMILQHYGITFFHASQIALGDKGVLFTAPSGTGKTTQAHLWETHCSAKILCNDRTLVRAGRTYSYPLDGSEPVALNETKTLAAIIVLGQAKENQIVRLRPGAAVSALMPQLIIDAWSSEVRETAISQLLTLIRKIPVYRFLCKPDFTAVECLKQTLMKEGVIP